MEMIVFKTVGIHICNLSPEFWPVVYYEGMTGGYSFVEFGRPVQLAQNSILPRKPRFCLEAGFRRPRNSFPRILADSHRERAVPCAR